MDQRALTQKWLRENVASYGAAERVFADIDAVLLRFPSLRPKSDVYTYDDGRTQLLLCIHGLLPISFRGQSYNIPIAIWLTRDYPREPPLPYVVPTADMLVKPGPHLDVSGRSSIDYVLQWARKSEGCSLSALIDALQAEFSRVPPVYAKPKESQALQGSPQRSQASPQPQAQQQPPQLPTRPGQQPPLPPKPQTPQTTPPQISHNPSSSPSHVAQNPVRGPHPHYNPQYVQHGPQAPHAHPNQIQSPGYTGVAPTPTPPHANPAPQYHQAPPSIVNAGTPLGAPLPPPLPPHPHAHPRADTSDNPNPSPLPGPPQYRAAPAPAPAPPHYQAPSGPHVPWGQSPPPPRDPQWTASPYLHPASPPVLQPPPQPQVPIQVPVPVQAHGFTPVHAAPAPAPNLLDEDTPGPDANALHPSQPSPGAPAPPRPPNPELLRLHAAVHAKLSSELASLGHALSLDAERLRAHQADLLAGEPALRDEMARLEAVRDVCRTAAGRMRGAVEAAERNVAELKAKSEPEVDELVCSTTIVHNQLINLVAEDNAIEDTIFHLSKALNSGRIDLERFLRSTRLLAEEQFMKRALIEKISNAIPMGQPGY